MKHSKPFKHYGRWLPWTTGTLAFAGLAGTLFALSEVLENDTDGDGWTDAEEIIVGTDPADETDPWDSDGDGIADYLEFLDGTNPLDPNDPPQARGASAAYSVAVAANETTESGDDSATNILNLPAPTRFTIHPMGVFLRVFRGGVIPALQGLKIRIETTIT